MTPSYPSRHVQRQARIQRMKDRQFECLMAGLFAALFLVAFVAVTRMALEHHVPAGQGWEICSRKGC